MADMALTWSNPVTTTQGFTYSIDPAGLEQARQDRAALVTVEAELEETETELAIVQDKLRRAMILITRMSDDENVMPTPEEYEEFIAPIVADEVKAS